MPHAPALLPLRDGAREAPHGGLRDGPPELENPEAVRAEISCLLAVSGDDSVRRLLVAVPVNSTGYLTLKQQESSLPKQVLR